MAAGTSALLLLLAGAVAGVVALTGAAAGRTVVTATGENAAGDTDSATGDSATGDSATGDSAGDSAAGDEGRASGEMPANGPRSGVRRGSTALPRTASDAGRTAPRHLTAEPSAPGVTDSGSRPPSPSPTSPVVTSRTDVETRQIPFETRVVRDPSSPRGTRRIQTPGVPGVETLRYLVTLTDGQPTDRRLLDATVTRQPRHQVVVLGTKRPPAPHAECGQALNICVPLGRSALCLSAQPSLSASADPAGTVADTDAGVTAVAGPQALAPDRPVQAGDLPAADTGLLGDLAC
jgi:hypothetical protein